MPAIAACWRAPRASRGETIANVILFVVLIIAALILIVWYAQSVRPTKHVIDATEHDLEQLDQHFENACVFEEYRATQLLHTRSALLRINMTHFCIVSEVYGACESAACDAEPTELSIGREPATIRITRDGGLIRVSRE